MARKEHPVRTSAPTTAHLYALFMQGLIGGALEANSLDDTEIRRGRIVFEERPRAQGVTERKQ